MGFIAEEAVLQKLREALFAVVGQQQAGNGPVGAIAHRRVEVHEILVGEPGVEHALDARLAGHGILVIGAIAHIHRVTAGRMLHTVGVDEVDGVEGGDLAHAEQPFLARSRRSRIRRGRCQSGDGLDVALGIAHEGGRQLSRLVGGIGHVLARLGHDAVGSLLHEHGERNDHGHEHDDEGRHRQPVLPAFVLHTHPLGPLVSIASMIRDEGPRRGYKLKPH